MKKYNLYLLLLIVILSSCSDFLEESSQDLMIPKSVKDYKELLFGEILKNGEVLHPYLEYMTDDVKDQCFYHHVRGNIIRYGSSYVTKYRSGETWNCISGQTAWTYV